VLAERKRSILAVVKPTMIQFLIPNVSLPAIELLASKPKGVASRTREVELFPAITSEIERMV
jgi:hypothetical protein